MLYAVFNGHGMFVVLATLLSATVGFVVYKQSPSGTERRALKGLFGASVTAVVSLTLWSTGSPIRQPRVCVVNRDLVEPFTTDQGLLNAGLFLPIGLLGALATRKVVGTIAFGIVLTLAIETLQGSLTFLGRGCDTSDLLMNSLGVAVGALAGWLITTFEKPRANFLHPWRARSAYAAVSTVAGLALVWGLAIEPQPVDQTLGIGRASSAQEEAIQAAVDDAFDGHYEVSRVDFASGPDGTGTVMAQFVGGGSAELRWPDRETFHAYLDMSSTGETSGYPLPGSNAAPGNEQQAQAVAQTYAARHAAWGLKDAQPKTTKVGDKAELGWMTSWRRFDRNGVLMPMRLDIQVDRVGRVSQLIMTSTPDPRISAPRISKEDAVTAVLTAHKLDEGTLPRADVAAALLATKNNGAWIPVWRIEVPGKQPITGSVDAVTGTVIDEGP
ncbi:VanZ family protein [Streptomyces sp. NPDC053431]|uniref:VanZ family protein n=1 Tax=Streptomyces sp. NPDC053431 TaxID=3365703 RepID=UPI0037D61687